MICTLSSHHNGIIIFLGFSTPFADLLLLVLFARDVSSAASFVDPAWPVLMNFDSIILNHVCSRHGRYNSSNRISWYLFIIVPSLPVGFPVPACCFPRRWVHALPTGKSRSTSEKSRHLCTIDNRIFNLESPVKVYLFNSFDYFKMNHHLIDDGGLKYVNRFSFSQWFYVL